MGNVAGVPLANAKVAETVQNALLFHDGAKYKLHSWTIMPNHIHLIVDVWDIPLATLVGKWKGKSAHLANALLRRRGKYWQEDYFDTLIRNAEHLKRAIRYTEQNPVKAFLVKSANDWQWSSARHRDEYGRLRLPEGKDGARASARFNVEKDAEDDTP